jgi:ATP-dependent DNA helicase RecG
MIDSQGFGIHGLYMAQKERYLPMPDYDLSDLNHVRLIIPGQVINNDYSQLLMENTQLDLATTVLLGRIQKKRAISKEAATHLRKLKLIEGRIPNLIISKRIAKATHTEVEYTKMKGFDDQYYKDLILKALNEHGKLGRVDFESLLLNKLPEVLDEDQKRRKVGNLLTSLRKSKLIISDKNRKWGINNHD